MDSRWQGISMRPTPEKIPKTRPGLLGSVQSGAGTKPISTATCCVPLLASTIVLVAFGFLLLAGCTRVKNPTGPDAGSITWSEPDVVFTPESGGVWYPRLVELADGTLLCAYDTNENSPHTRIRLSLSHDGGRTWQRGAVVAANADCDCANPHLVQLEDGTVLCAYREVGCAPFRIRVAASRDGGATWSLLSTADSSDHGLWEPFLLVTGPRTVHVFYSSEAYQPQYSQVVAVRTSSDAGKTWGETRVVASKAGSRDGMASVVVLPNGQWLCFFEATDEANPFVIKSVRSRDHGKTWGERSLVYAPGNSSAFASAPYGILLRDGSIVVTFQTTEDQDSLESSVRPALKYVRSGDGGKTWSEPHTIFSGGSGYWWNSIIQLRDGTLLAASSRSGGGKPAQIIVARGKMGR